jgi:hypothetical protein
VSDRQTTYVFESLPIQFSAEKDSLARRGQLAAHAGIPASTVAAWHGQTFA